MSHETMATAPVLLLGMWERGRGASVFVFSVPSVA